MENVSILDTVVKINGHTVRGWAPAADALSFPNIKFKTSEVGPDGLKVSSSTGMRGGDVIFKLQANSPSVKWFMQQIGELLGGATKVFKGTARNSKTGVTTSFERGELDDGPLGQTLGNAAPKQLEFTITFESIVSSYDGARTLEPPVRAA